MDVHPGPGWRSLAPHSADGPRVPLLVLQVLEFDLKGVGLDSSSFVDVIVKDYETIGKDK